MLGFIILLATAISGFAGAPWWAALAGGSAIAITLVADHLKMRARFAAVHAEDILIAAYVRALLTGCIAGAAAWALGRFSSWAYWP